MPRPYCQILAEIILQMTPNSWNVCKFIPVKYTGISTIPYSHTDSLSLRLRDTYCDRISCFMHDIMFYVKSKCFIKITFTTTYLLPVRKKSRAASFTRTGMETNCARIIKIVWEVGKCWLEMREFLPTYNYCMMVMPTIEQSKWLCISKQSEVPFHSKINWAIKHPTIAAPHTATDETQTAYL